MRYILLLLLCSCSIATPRTGQKIGQIVKLSTDGYFVKTCEGELIRGGFSDGSGVMGNVFHFTIEKEELKTIAKEAMESQREVIIEYEVELITSVFRSSECPAHFITNIRYKD